jgi:hypothetical protein
MADDDDGDRPWASPEPSGFGAGPDGEAGVEEPVPEGELVEVDNYPTIHEAALMRSKLISEGVRAWLRDEHTVGINPMLNTVVRGVKIVVSAYDADAARKVIDAARRAAISNEGRPVFRIRATKASSRLLWGVGLGCAVGMGIAALLAQPLYIVIATAGGAIIGAVNGARIRDDYCSGLRCAAKLAPHATVCPRCGGTIAGVIGSPDDRLEAEENLRKTGENSGESP